MPASKQAAITTSPQPKTHGQMRAALWLSTILCSGLSAPVLAQNVPPTFRQFDNNGVDVLTGTIRVAGPSISIGDASSRLIGNVAFTENGPELNISPNLTISLAVFPQKVSATVMLGGESEIFIDEAELLQPARFVSQKKNGATLECDGTPSTPRTKCFYTNAGGTKVEFNVPADTVFGIKPVAITYPDGEIIRFKNYSSPQPVGSIIPAPPFNNFVGIESNKGLAIATDSIGFFSRNVWRYAFPVNRAVENCSASGSTTSCNFSAPVTALINNATDRTVTDQAGGVWRWSANAQGRMATLRRPASPNADSVTIAYNSDGKVSSVTNENVTTTYSYAVDAPAAPGVTARTIATNSLGQQSVYEYKIGTGRVTSVRNALGFSTRFTYDTNGRVMSQTQPEGNGVSYAYDDRGNVLATTLTPKPGSGLSVISTSATYPATCANLVTCNNPTSTRDAKGNQTDYGYDSVTGLPLSVTLPAATIGGVRPQTRYSYVAKQAFIRDGANIVAAGAPVTLLDSTSNCQTLTTCAGTADEIKSKIDYGPQSGAVVNNLYPVSVTTGSGNNALSATTAFTYDTVGNSITVDGPLSGSADTTRTRYNAVRQVVGLISPDPDGAGPLKHRAQRTVYNANGQPTYAEVGTVNGVSEADWLGFVSLQQAWTYYDANGRTSRESVTAAGVNYAVTDYTYDALGRTDCVAQRKNPAVWGTQIWACYGQTPGASGPDRITRFVYNDVGQVREVQSALGTPDQQNVVQSYNPNGTVASLNDARDNRTTYEYDGFDRLAKTRFPLAATGWISSTTDFEALTYDVNGNVTQRRVRDGQVISYAYDTLNRLTFKDVPADAYENRDVSYTYDLLGRLKSATKADGFASSFTYDALGRKRSEGNGFGVIFYQYDLGGRVTQLTHGDGFFVTYDYDTLGKMLAIRESGSALLATYAYDDLGRRTSLTRGNGTVTSYAYDPVSRLASLSQDFAGTMQDVTSSFTYNTASQIATRSRNNDLYAWTWPQGSTGFTRPYTNNGLNQHVSVGGGAYAYDGRGNLTGDGTKSYLYTSENRLIGSPGVALFGYDALGQLAAIFTNKADYLMMADGVPQFEFNSVTGLLRRHVHGPGTDEPLLTYEGAGLSDKRYLHADERGSIIAVSNASGQVTQINAYDDYGIPQGKTPAGAIITNGTGLATTSFGRFGYTGQAWLPEIGLYHYKARAYSPTLGRFMQTDPIGYGDGSNLYAYVGNDPINGVDPSGLSCIVNGSGLGGSPTPSQGQSCGSNVTPDGTILVNGFPTPTPPPPPPPAAVGVAFISTGFAGSPAPAGFGAGAGLGANGAGAPTTPEETNDRTKRLLERLRELQRQIQMCNGAASSARCKPLYDEYLRILSSPEISRIMDRNFSDFQQAFRFTLDGIITIVSAGRANSVSGALKRFGLGGAAAAFDCFLSQCQR